MKKTMVVLIVFIVSLSLYSENFSGNYQCVSGNVQLNLMLSQNNNSLTGRLTGNTGADFQLKGEVEVDAATGTCSGNGTTLFFTLYFEDNQMYFELVEMGSDGEPDWTRLREFIFKRTSSNSAPPYTQTPSSNSVNSGSQQTHSNPLSTSSNTGFSGRFSGDGLTLNLIRNGNSVSGSMDYDGNSYNISGTISENTLNGTFSSPGGSFNFKGHSSGSTIQFETAGTVYNLKSAALSNPLSEQSQSSPNYSNESQNSQAPSNYSDNASSNQHQSNNSGQRINVDSMGISFIPPQNWICKKDTATGNYIMGSNSIPGFIIILPHSYQSLQELTSEAGEGFVDEGVQLYPSGPVENLASNSVGAEFSGTFQGNQAKAYVTGVVSPNGGGMLALCVTTSEKYSTQHKNSAIQLANSVQFYKPKIDETLINALAYNFYSYSGSTERKLTLCPNGIYYDSYESSYSGQFTDSGGYQTGAWGAGSSDSGNGRWKAVGTPQAGTIYFIHKNGSESQKQFQAGQGCMYIGGVKYGYNGKANCK